MQKRGVFLENKWTGGDLNLKIGGDVTRKPPFIGLSFNPTNQKDVISRLDKVKDCIPGSAHTGQRKKERKELRYDMSKSSLRF